MRLQIAGLLWEDNSYGNVPLDFSQGIVCLRIRQWHGSVHDTQILGYRRLVWCSGFKRLSQAYYTMVMVCSTGLNPIGLNWGENALVTKYSGTLEL